MRAGLCSQRGWEGESRHGGGGTQVDTRVQANAMSYRRTWVEVGDVSCRQKCGDRYMT